MGFATVQGRQRTGFEPNAWLCRLHGVVISPAARSSCFCLEKLRRSLERREVDLGLVRDRVRPGLWVVLRADAVHSVPLVGGGVPLPEEDVPQVRPAVRARNFAVCLAAPHRHVATLARVVAVL